MERCGLYSLGLETERSAGLFKKDDEILEYVKARTFLADHLFTPQKELFPLVLVNYFKA
jgi:hypothetical protein